MKQKTESNFNFATREFIFNVLAMFKLIFNSYRNRFQGPYFNFIQPLIIVVIYGFLIAHNVNSPNPYVQHQARAQLVGLIPGLMCTGAFGIGVSSLSFNLLLYKESVIIKRIAITPITKNQFIFSALLFFLIVALISGLWVWGWIFIFFYKELNSLINLSSLAWFLFFLGWIITIIVCIMTGLFLTAISSSTQQSLGLSQLFFFFQSFFAGSTLSPVLLKNSAPLRWISFFCPWRYPIQITREGFFNQNWFDPNPSNPLSLTSYGNTSAFTKFGPPDWFAFLISILFFILLYFAVKKLFKWDK